ncbi:unnamed protein product [Laminaria digitata]
MTRADGLKLLTALALLVAVALDGVSLLSIGGPLLIFGLLVLHGVFVPQSGLLLPVIDRVATDRMQVALTFDDGPDPQVTPAVLEALAAAGARATFFVIGRNLRAHPELGRQIVAAGHELANHSDAHPRTLNLRGTQTMQAEISRGAEAVQAMTGQPARLYRPPIGLKSPPLARVARRLGLQVVMWSCHARDTGSASAAQIAARVLGRVRPGDIVLLHDGHDRAGTRRAQTAEAVQGILAGLKARGLEAVTVSELLQAS